LVKLKKDNNVFNFDFIAFGKFQISKNGFKQLWHEFKRDFFQKFLASGYVDSISLYTLENISKLTPPSPSPLHGEGKSPLSEPVPSLAAGELRGAGGEVTCSQSYY